MEWIQKIINRNEKLISLIISSFKDMSFMRIFLSDIREVVVLELNNRLSLIHWVEEVLDVYLCQIFRMVYNIDRFHLVGREFTCQYILGFIDVPDVKYNLLKWPILSCYLKSLESFVLVEWFYVHVWNEKDPSYLVKNGN